MMLRAPYLRGDRCIRPKPYISAQKRPVLEQLFNLQHVLISMLDPMICAFHPSPYIQLMFSVFNPADTPDAMRVGRSGFSSHPLSRTCTSVRANMGLIERIKLAPLHFELLTGTHMLAPSERAAVCTCFISPPSSPLPVL